MNLIVRKTEASDRKGLALLFSAFVQANYESMFHPHALDVETAYGIASYTGLDYYCCAWDSEMAVGYGMLRGFDAGYTVPSLGIATHPDFRGIGVARIVIEHLHHTAWSRGAKTVRLRVYTNNAAARSLYHRLGYTFEDEVSQGQLVGTCILSAPCTRP
jgi:ribosomal protein S18 acetylase RimI-like enzyme